MLRVVLLVVLAAGASGFQAFQQKIPNGDKVPDPCDAAKKNVWGGVGHWNYMGGGELNPFGEDFKAANLTWTVDLCKKDSDGDERSNGVELGDPQCVWTPGKGAPSLPPSGHPGICEPLGSSLCAKQKGKVSCCGSHACPP